MKRSIPIPKDSAGFFRARARNPAAFQFTADGNLQVPVIREQPATVIELPFYRSATVDELAELEQAQKDQIAQIEEQFDAKMDEYLRALASYRETGVITDILRFQRELTILDSQRSILRSPIRWIQEIGNPVKRDLFPDEFYRTEHIGYTVFKWNDRKFKFEDLVREGKEPEEEVGDEGEAAGGAEGIEGAEGGDDELLLLFYGTEDDKTGFMSPEFPIEFVFNSTKYTSPLQAYEVERIMKLGKAAVRPVLMKTRSAKTVRTVAAGIPGHESAGQPLWTEIYNALMDQHPEFGKKLLETGTDRLVYADPVDMYAGIGLPLEDPSALNRAAWKGQNWLGLALEAVRNRLRLEAADAAAAGGEGEDAAANQNQGGGALPKYTDHARTEKEANEEKAKYIMGQRRAGGGR